MSLIYGIDEAGRGCIIGPLVMGRAGIDPRREHELVELGVKDSKKLTPKQRESLYEPVRALCDSRTHHLSAADITTQMDSLNLNDIEAQTIAGLLDDVPLDSQVFIDSPDNVPIKFASRIQRFRSPAPHLVCENKAEDRYPIVAAASILAKVERDRAVERIREELGYDFNSGYPSDPQTVAFLTRHLHEAKVKPYIRWKWATLDHLKQKKMSDY